MIGSDWVYWLAASVLGAVGLPLLWWAGWSDRGKRRCPRCWYDMTATPGLRCPECGKQARSERELMRARRKRWWMAAAGLAIVGAGGLALTPTCRREGYWWWAPTGVLLRLEGTLGGAAQRGIGGELDERTWGRPRPSPAEWRALAARAMGVSMMRTRWPSGVEIFIPSLASASGFSRSCLGERVIRLQLPEKRVPDDLAWLVRPKRESFEEFWSDGRLALGSIPADGVVRWRCRALTAFETLFEGELALQLQIGGGVDDVLQPQRAPELTEAIRRQLNPRLIKQPASGAPGVAITAPRGEVLKGLTLGLAIEFLRRGEVVAQAGAWLRPDRPAVSGPNPLFVRGDVDALLGADKADPEWTVRIRGDGVMALRDYSAERYWDGEFTLPLEALYK